MESKKAYVYYEDYLAGILEEVNNKYIFTYNSDYLLNQFARPVSLTLPLRQEAYESEILFSFFEGLIPEGWYLDESKKIIAFQKREDKFFLLTELCQNTLGAVSIEKNIR